MYEDTFRARQLNELKIQQENSTLDLLKKCLSESNEQTRRMANLLDNFETRLNSLNDIVMPVYEATNALQIKHSNIQNTVMRLDKIIDYYSSVKNLSLIIQAGPGKDINAYLSQLNKLKAAIDYFAANKNQSQKKQNVNIFVKLFKEKKTDREKERERERSRDNDLFFL